jgi:hypothetical protein
VSLEKRIELERGVEGLKEEGRNKKRHWEEEKHLYQQKQS